jgi:hypothetical protein
VQFAMMMNGIGAAFRCDVSKETMAIFFNYLKNNSIESVRFATDKVIETGERFPTVKLMREHANAYRKPQMYIPSQSVQIEEFSQEEIERCKSMSFEDIIKQATERATLPTADH